MSGNCPRCGGPLTAAGNCANLCGGAVVPTGVLAFLVRRAVGIPADPFAAFRAVSLR